MSYWLTCADCSSLGLDKATGTEPFPNKGLCASCGGPWPKRTVDFMDIPACPKCEELGQKSQVSSTYSSSTLISSAPYRDEEGRFHNHDPNWHTSEYRCSAGHEFHTKKKAKCPSCDVGGEVEGPTLAKPFSIFGR